MKIADFPVKNAFTLILSGFLCGFLPTFFGVGLFSFVFIIPFIAVIYDEKPNFLKAYLWGFFWYFGTIWWMTLVDVKGLWLLIVAGCLLLSASFALRFLFIAVLSFFVARKCKKTLFLFIPSLWIITEYLLTLGELPFPWMFKGYSLVNFTCLAQTASVTGVWGLSFLAVIAAVIIYERLFEKRNPVFVKVFAAALLVLCLFGFLRVHTGQTEYYEESAFVLQPNADQQNWDGYSSLIESLGVLDSLFYVGETLSNGFFVLPESALFTYLKNRSAAQSFVADWTRKHGKHIIFGSLTPVRDEEQNLVSALNSAYWANPQKGRRYENLERYGKIKLVPFVESRPFSDVFPMINRLELAGGGFTAGSENSVWEMGENLSVAPFICYESIFPNFTRERINKGRVPANVMVNITNDGWFGRTTAPLQHAEMSRVRAIETGVGMIRSANSGISFSVDPYGRYLSKTQIYTRQIVEMPIAKPLPNTFYRKFGDWFVFLCIATVIAVATLPPRPCGRRAALLFRRLLRNRLIRSN